MSLLVLEGDAARLAAEVAELALVRVPESAAAAASNGAAPEEPDTVQPLTVREAT